jgi:hypothetical protein
MDSEAIEEYVEYAREILDANSQMDEANTKATLVRKLLELLGWRVGTDVDLEYPVQMATRTHKVDYALLLEDTPMVFVEAKGCDSSLSDDHREQLRSYMKAQNVDWGLLTNGQTNEFYQRHVENAQVTVDRLGNASVGQLVQKSELLSALSKESIESGKSEQIAKRIVEIDRAKNELRENKDKISEEIARIIAERVGDSISKQAENEAKTLVDNLVAELEDEAEVEYGGTQSDDFWAEVERKIGITKEDENLVFAENKSATRQFQLFVNLLFEQYSLSDEDLPVESGPKRHLINTKPIHKSGEQMREAKSVGYDFHLETHHSIKDMKVKMKSLSESFS